MPAFQEPLTGYAWGNPPTTSLTEGSRVNWSPLPWLQRSLMDFHSRSCSTQDPRVKSHGGGGAMGSCSLSLVIYLHSWSLPTAWKRGWFYGFPQPFFCQETCKTMPPLIDLPFGSPPTAADGFQERRDIVGRGVEQHAPLPLLPQLFGGSGDRKRVW